MSLSEKKKYRSQFQIPQKNGPVYLLEIGRTHIAEVAAA